MKKENQDTKKAMLRIVEDEEATSGTSSLKKKQAEETDASAVAQSEEPEESVVAKDETEDTETATEAADNEAIKRYVEDEEDEDEFGEISLKSILGGDILQSKFFVRQVIFVLFVVALMLAYTANRYNSQQEIITIDTGSCLEILLQVDLPNIIVREEPVQVRPVCLYRRFSGESLHYVEYVPYTSDRQQRR